MKITDKELELVLDAIATSNLIFTIKSKQYKKTDIGTKIELTNKGIENLNAFIFKVNEEKNEVTFRVNTYFYSKDEETKKLKFR